MKVCNFTVYNNDNVPCRAIGVLWLIVNMGHKTVYNTQLLRKHVEAASVVLNYWSDRPSLFLSVFFLVMC